MILHANRSLCCHGAGAVGTRAGMKGWMSNWLVLKTKLAVKMNVSQRSCRTAIYVQVREQDKVRDGGDAGQCGQGMEKGTQTKLKGRAGANWKYLTLRIEDIQKEYEWESQESEKIKRETVKKGWEESK
jgi:hypothetical protein